MTPDVVGIRTKENQAVEGWLLFWEDRLLAYEAAREEVMGGKSRTVMVGGQRGGKTSATEAKGLKLAELAQREPWLMFVKDFEAMLGSSAPNLLVVLRLRRQYRNYRGRRGWVGPVQVRYPMEVAAVTGKPAEGYFLVSRNSFHGMWRDIVDLAAREAIRRGLV